MILFFLGLLLGIIGTLAVVYIASARDAIAQPAVVIDLSEARLARKRQRLRRWLNRSIGARR